MNKIWIRGDIISENEAVVNVMSPTSQFGLNVFEGVRGYWNDEKAELYVFKLEEHIDRLFQSCKLVDIPLIYTKEEIIKFTLDIIKANNFKDDIALRMTIFGDGIGSWHSTDDFSMFISPIEKPRKDINHLEGLKACISSWRRIEDNVMPPKAKVGANYINGRYALLESKRKGCNVPILLDSRGKVSESSGACIFLIRDGELIAPSIDSSILESITRDVVMEIAKDNNIKVTQRIVDRSELIIADEVFLVGSAAEITPITYIDGISIGNGKVGTITKEILQKYLEIVSGKVARYQNDLTLVK